MRCIARVIFDLYILLDNKVDRVEMNVMTQSVRFSKNIHQNKSLYRNDPNIS